MSEKTKLERGFHSRMSLNVDGYKCKSFMGIFSIYLVGFQEPKYCPLCGVEFDTERTPTKIVKKINNLYHKEELERLNEN